MYIEEILLRIITYAALAIGLIASIIIILGVAVGIVNLIQIQFSKENIDKKVLARKKVRQRLGENLLLGLEVLIAADIIESIANPTLSELARLGTIVIIRTFISYFLNKEIKENN